MAWQIEYLNSTEKQLRKLDPPISRQVVAYMRERVLASGDPYSLGKGLTGVWAGHWRYRVGDYRIVSRIRGERLIVMVVRVAHRSTVYDPPLPHHTEEISS